MSDIIGVITKIEDDKDYNDKDFKKVTLGDGQVLKVKRGRDNFLKDKWGLLQEGIGIKFIMQDYTKPDGVKIPFVFDIETVEGQLPPPQPPEPLPEQMQEPVDEALKAVPPKPLPEPAPQAVGMITKEIGDMIRAKYLVAIFGEEAGHEIIRWYRGQVLGITRIPYDGEGLPKFEVRKQNVEPDMKPPLIGDEVPF